MAKVMSCPRCGRESYFAVVAKYIWPVAGKYDIDDGYVHVSDANICRCERCGEIPVDSIEKQRWEMLAYKQEASDRGEEDIQCSVCGVPRIRTGQFFTLGWEPDQIHFCDGCYDMHQRGALAGPEQAGE